MRHLLSRSIFSISALSFLLFLGPVGWAVEKKPVQQAGVVLSDAVAKQKIAVTQEEAGILKHFAQPPIQDAHLYFIQPGDFLNVRALDGPELHRQQMTLEVAPDGKIKFPYLGQIFVAGLTPEELALGLETGLKKYFATPQIYVFVTKKATTVFVSGKFDMYGEIGRPGKYLMTEGLVLSDAILQAGGFTEFARKNSEKIVRGQGPDREVIKVKVGKIYKTGDKTLDVELKEGDIVIVPESWF